MIVDREAAPVKTRQTAYRKTSQQPPSRTRGPRAPSCWPGRPPCRTPEPVGSSTDSRSLRDHRASLQSLPSPRPAVHFLIALGDDSTGDALRPGQDCSQVRPKTCLDVRSAEEHRLLEAVLWKRSAEYQLAELWVR